MGRDSSPCDLMAKDLEEYLRLSSNSFRISTCKKIGVMTGPAFFCKLTLFIPTALLVTSVMATAFGQSAAPARDLLSEAQSLFKQAKFGEAEGAVRQYLKDHPDSAEGHFLLGHVLFREIQAHAMLETQFQSQAHGPMGGVKTLGRTPSDAPDLKGAAEMAKASLEEFTAGARFHDPSAADLKIVAFDYVLLGDYPDADKWLGKMLEWAPNDSEGWYYLGRTKYNENRFEEAIEAFRRCLRLDPKNVKAEDNLGLSFAGLGRNDEAAAAYKLAIAWQEQSLPKNPGPYIDLGNLLLEQNHPQDAIPFLLRAIEIAPRESRAHELLGKAYTRAEDFPKAQTELERAIELSPQTPNLHCMIAPVYRKQGLAERAKTEYERCAALTGTHSTPETPRQ
jgi:tetratricopeptide (TPR) repeat protein